MRTLAVTIVWPLIAAAAAYTVGWHTAISEPATRRREERRDRKLMRQARADFRRALERGTAPALIPPPFRITPSGITGGIVPGPGPVILGPADFPLIRREDPRLDESDDRNGGRG